MAQWLEQTQGIGERLLDTIGEGAGAQLEKAVMPKRESPDNPSDRPETQEPATIRKPESGPEAREPVKGAGDALEDMKWYAAGALALVALAAIWGAR